MSTSTDIAQITYPQSDGQPMADNTKQIRWIVTIQGGLDALFRADSPVFVADDLLWYPVEGRSDMCMAPDVLVAVGRPKGDRGSYLQWEEGGIAPQVVFEIRSPGNTLAKACSRMCNLRFNDLTSSSLISIHLSVTRACPRHCGS